MRSSWKVKSVLCWCADNVESTHYPCTRKQKQCTFLTLRSWNSRFAVISLNYWCDSICWILLVSCYFESFSLILSFEKLKAFANISLPRKFYIMQKKICHFSKKNCQHLMSTYDSMIAATCTFWCSLIAFRCSTKKECRWQCSQNWMLRH